MNAQEFLDALSERLTGELGITVRRVPLGDDVLAALRPPYGLVQLAGVDFPSGIKAGPIKYEEAEPGKQRVTWLVDDVLLRVSLMLYDGPLADLVFSRLDEKAFLIAQSLQENPVVENQDGEGFTFTGRVSWEDEALEDEEGVSITRMLSLEFVGQLTIQTTEFKVEEVIPELEE